MNENIFSARIRQRRRELGLTTHELGRRIYICGDTVGKYERGVMMPRLDTAFRLADALGVSFAWLVGLDALPYSR